MRKSILAVLFLSVIVLFIHAAEEESKQLSDEEIEYAPGYEREESFYDYYYGREKNDSGSKDTKEKDKVEEKEN